MLTWNFHPPGNSGEWHYGNMFNMCPTSLHVAEDGAGDAIEKKYIANVST